MLVLNPCSFPRSIEVNWGREIPSPAAAEPVKARQFDEERSVAVVEVPACGFAWVAGAGGSSKPDKVPMAEKLLLRNDFLEVALSEVTGGIGQIRTYQRGGNRISQQLAYRFQRERTITVGEGEQAETYKSYYSEMLMRSSRVLSAGPAVGEIETVGDVVDQHQKKLLAEYRQVTRVVRGRPFVEIDLELDLKTVPDGDPWTNYYAARFAWKYETVALSGSLHHGAHTINTDRIEAPQFIELADEGSRTTILPCGLPYHRKTGPRMLDTLLVVAGETRRRFKFAVAVDQPYPIQSAIDVAAPVLAVPTTGSPSGGSSTGWLFHLSAGNVQLTRLLPLPGGETASDVVAGLPTEPPRQGCVIRLVETEGRRKTAWLRCFRSPTAARQVDFHGQTINKLALEGDGVRVDVRPYEVCDVEVLWA
jgi:alpha-mannosidase